MSQGRHRGSPRKLHPAVIAAAVVVVAALGVSGYLIFAGDGNGGGLFGLGGPDPTIPEFDFKVGRTEVVSTNATPREELASAAEGAAASVVEPMTALYVEAFLDPANWREGVYDEVWPLFEAEAAAQAQRDVAVLTLGTGAGDSYDSVLPEKGKLSFDVLMDDRGAPATIVVVVRFSATAEGKDGDLTRIKSLAQFFLRDTGSGWLIFSYDVTRDDRLKAEPTPTPTSAAS